jgi:hypothetical protein
VPVDFRLCLLMLLIFSNIFIAIIYYCLLFSFLFAYVYFLGGGKVARSVDISIRAPWITTNEEHIMACTNTNCTGMQDFSRARCPQMEGHWKKKMFFILLVMFYYYDLLVPTDRRHSSLADQSHGVFLVSAYCFSFLSTYVFYIVGYVFLL